MVVGEESGHDVVDFSVDQFTLVVAEDALCGEVYLIHDTWVFSVKLEKDDPVLFNANVIIALCIDLYFFFVFHLELYFFCFLQNLKALFLIIKDFNQVSGIQVIGLYVLELLNIFPLIIHTNFQRKQDVGQVIQFLQITLWIS